MAVIKKKLWKQYFDLMNSGKKKYEFRLNEFDVKEGDTLILEEWDPETKSYTGRTIENKVAYVSNFTLDDLPWTRKEIEEKGFKLLSLE